MKTKALASMDQILVAALPRWSTAARASVVISRHAHAVAVDVKQFNRHSPSSVG